VGAKDWMLFHANGEVRPILKAAPQLNRAETRAMVERLYPARHLVEIEDGCLDVASPPHGQVYAGWPSSVPATWLFDRPSQLEQRFLAEGKGRITYLHAMHSLT
jgi:hypothetical protein